jgi:hypothetical protein
LADPSDTTLPVLDDQHTIGPGPGMKPVFFTSYARADNHAKKVEKTILALRKRLRDKLGWSAGDVEQIGFFDTTSISTGQEWEHLLAEALKKSRILVCLCSPSYLSSIYCAREFHVFRRRLKEAGETMKEETAIIPVIWEWGSPKMMLPRALRSYYQDKDPKFPQKYWDGGLSPLARIASQSWFFDQTIEALAKLIGEAHDASKLKDWNGAVKFDELPSFFDDTGEESAPYNVTVSVLHKDRLQWRPFVSGPALGGRVSAWMGRHDFVWREINASTADFEQMLDEAAHQKQVSVVIAENASVDEPQWHGLLQVVDQLSLENCAVLLAWNEGVSGPGVPAEIKAKLQALLPHIGHSPLHGFFVQDDGDTFDRALSCAVTAGRNLLRTKTVPQKVESPALRAEAMEEGIAPDSRPTLTGPGGKNEP